MATDLTVLNAALTRIGEDPISTIDGSSVPQKIASANYERLVEACLSVYPWKRASNAVALSRLDPDEEGDPPEPWTAAYQIPSEATEIITVKVSGYPIAYQVWSDKILCDAAAADEVFLHHVWRAQEADWPPWFREGITLTLEAIFLRGIGERHRDATARDEAAKEWWRMAKNRDSQSQPPRDPMGSPTLAARGGSLARSTLMPINAR